MRRRLATAAVLGIVLLGSVVPAAFAECMNWPMRSSERPRVAFAFTATVGDVVRGDYPPFEADSHFRYRVTVKVDRVYRGRVPKGLELTGTNVGCSFFAVGGLKEGDRLFIASEQFVTGRDETWFGDVLAWRRTGDRWVFYEDVLRDGSNPEFYPRAARAASTTADIVRLITAAPLPDTSTLPTRDEPTGPPVHLALAILFAASFKLAMRRLWRTRTSPRTVIRPASSEPRRCPSRWSSGARDGWFSSRSGGTGHLHSEFRSRSRT